MHLKNTFCFLVDHLNLLLFKLTFGVHLTVWKVNLFKKSQQF